VSNITFLVPTPKTIYPVNHPNAKFELLNLLNINIMDRTERADGRRSHADMESLVREIVEYNHTINEHTQYQTYGGGQKYGMVRIPVSKDEDEFRKEKIING